MPAGPCHAFSRSSPASILPMPLCRQRFPTNVRTICPSPGFPCTMQIAWCIQPGSRFLALEVYGFFWLVFWIFGSGMPTTEAVCENFSGVFSMAFGLLVFRRRSVTQSVDPFLMARCSLKQACAVQKKREGWVSGRTFQGLIRVMSLT